MFELTNQQNQAIKLAQMGKDLKIEALAGCGKTTTLVEIAKAMCLKKGIYLAFNRQIANESKKKMPLNVSSSTVHSLAYKSVGSSYAESNRLIFGDWRHREIDNVFEELKLKNKFYSASLVIEALNKFTQSASQKLNESHIPIKSVIAYVNKLKRKENKYKKVKNFNKMIKKTIKINTILSRKIWSQICDENSKFPITHDCYLKMWALSKPTLNADFILFDEAQDANPVIIDILENQKSQIILVGDSYQQIYRWRGTANAMTNFKADNICFLTKSFRFGDEIAKVASLILHNYLGSSISVIGNKAINSEVIISKPARVSNVDVVIFRKNISIIDFAVKCFASKIAVNIEMDVDDLKSQIKAVQLIKEGQQASHQNFKYIENWDQLIEESKSDPSLSRLVKLVEKYSSCYLINLLSLSKSKDAGGITLTTAHKCKGKEWDNVVIYNDFEKADKIPDEANLLYVAVTRAKKVLNIRMCELASKNYIKAA